MLLIHANICNLHGINYVKHNHIHSFYSFNDICSICLWQIVLMSLKELSPNELWVILKRLHALLFRKCHPISCFSQSSCFDLSFLSSKYHNTTLDFLRMPYCFKLPINSTLLKQCQTRSLHYTMMLNPLKTGACCDNFHTVTRKHIFKRSLKILKNCMHSNVLRRIRYLTTENACYLSQKKVNNVFLIVF